MYDVVLIGAGIMSATLAKLLKELNPNFKILILESQPTFALESSGSWNNAGTGHAGYCELNYTPEVNGKIDISKALHVTEAFEMSRQFWAYLAEKNELSPSNFIHSIPHMSLVESNDIPYLRRRYAAMKKHHFYKDMKYSEELSQLSKWMPLVINNRNNQVAATYMEKGSDVDFGQLTQQLLLGLAKSGVEIKFNAKVTKLKPYDSHYTKKPWHQQYRIIYEQNGKKLEAITDFTFIGAGGNSILLLEKTKIPESKGYAGFPVSGQWLVCKNKEVIEKHHAKVYGKASVGAPPMSVPHLDTRVIDGEKQLLFGPYAGFTTKFLKHGSWLDLFKSIRLNNIYPLLAAGWNNIPLTKYLIKEVTRSKHEKFAELKRYYPDANEADWELQVAGQRVQVIKKDKEKGGKIEFGTEVITSSCGSLAALHGASPGASTAVHIMVSVIEKCFPQMQTEKWKAKMSEMIPSYGKSLIDDANLYADVKTHINEKLGAK